MSDVAFFVDIIILLLLYIFFLCTTWLSLVTLWQNSSEKNSSEKNLSGKKKSEHLFQVRKCNEMIMKSNLNLNIKYI